MIIRELSITLFILTLVGCGTVTMNQNPALLSTTHGYAIIHFPRTAGNLIVRSQNQKEYSFGYKSGVNSYGLWLPPGKYQLEVISYRDRSNKLEGFPDFEIKQSQLTNLGSLVDVNIGKDKIIWLPKIFTFNEDLVQDTLQTNNAYFKNKDVIEWSPTEIPLPSKLKRRNSGLGLVVDWIMMGIDKSNESALRKKLIKAKSIDDLYEIFLKLTPPLNYQKPAVDDKFNLYYGGELGQIKKRSINGSWVTINTNNTKPITAVAWHKNVLLAGNVAGKILMSKNSGKTWEQFILLSKNEIVFDLDIINNTLYIVTGKPDFENKLNIKGLLANIYITDIDKMGVPKLIKSVEYSNIKPRAESYGNWYIFGNGPDYLVKMDIESGLWYSIKTPANYNSFHVSAHNGIITLFSTNGGSSNVYISTDYGISWEKRKAPPYQINDVYFNDFKNGIAYTVSFSGNYIFEYNENKNKWARLVKVADECKYLMSDFIYDSISCFTNNGEILILSNKKWELEPYM